VAPVSVVVHGSSICRSWRQSPVSVDRLLVAPVSISCRSWLRYLLFVAPVAPVSVVRGFSLSVVLMAPVSCRLVLWLQSPVSVLRLWLQSPAPVLSVVLMAPVSCRLVRLVAPVSSSSICRLVLWPQCYLLLFVARLQYLLSPVVSCDSGICRSWLQYLSSHPVVSPALR